MKHVRNRGIAPRSTAIGPATAPDARGAGASDLEMATGGVGNRLRHLRDLIIRPV
jgi:hypothetical protein